MRDLALQNRLAMAPMTRARSGADRVPNSLMAEYYRQRSGAGLIVTEATTVSEQGNGWVNSPGIYTDEMEAGWKPVVEAIHGAGSRVFLQLWHCGRAAHSSFLGGELPVAPSAIKIEGEGVHTATGKQPHEVPRALEASELPGIVADYVQAAERAKRAGFDGVEIHSANGYLLDEFLQSKTNQRTDEYGGSPENRFRLLREIVTAVTQVFPADRVAVRLSPNGVFNDMGSPDFRETFSYAAMELSAFGLAYLHVMDGLGFGFHELGEAMTLKEFRAVYDGPLMGNCGYDLDMAKAAVEAGDADMIAFGRPFIANPDLVERFENGWPLAESDPSQWYSGEHAEEGYTDFPRHGS
ncbi:MAG: alkene reductase [Planctomycetota bacterium]